MPTPTFGHLNSPRGAVQGMNWVWDAVLLDWVPETQPGSISAGADGALLDGVNTAIRATVKNYTNSKPLTVVTVDTNGDPVSSGGTVQYAEDTAATAGEQVVMVGTVRKDVRGTLVDTDGDRAELQVNASGDLRVDGSAVTQPVSAASLPLPAGAATAAKQDTGNTSLASLAGTIDTNLAVRVDLASIGGLATAIAVNTGAPGADVLRVVISGKGTALSANSNPVVIASDQAAVPVTANAGTNLNTSALNLEATQALVKAKTDNLDVALSTRLKPADTLAAVTLVSTLSTITNVVHVDDNAGSLTIDNANLDVALSTRLKPADTLAGVTLVGTVSTITNVVHVDDNAGSLTVDGTVAVSNAFNLEATQLLVKAKTDNIDVLLSTRTKPSDQQHVIVDSSAAVVVSGTVATTVASGANTDLALILAVYQTQLLDLLKDIRTELRVLNTVGAVGLNVKDDLDNLRNDPSYLN